MRAVVGLLIAALLLAWKPWLGAVAAVVSVAVGLTALASPLDAYAGLERLVGGFGHLLGLAVSWLTLTVVYVAVVTPLGLLLRARRRLSITRRPDPDAVTYWRRASTTPSPERYERQY